MRRTLNVKFLLYLVAGLVVASGGVALAHHMQYRRIPLALLRQAQKAEDENDLVRAEDYLARYLDFAPEDIEQKVRLARLLTSKKFQAVTRSDPVKALFVLQDILARDPDQQEMRRLFVPLAIQMNRLEDAAQQLKLLPHDAETAGLWGRWHEAKDDSEQAVKYYTEAVKLNPADTETVTRFANLLRGRAWPRLSAVQAADKRQADAREADRVMDELIKANPDSWEARLARWNYNRSYWLLDWHGEERHPQLEEVRSLLLKQAARDVTKAMDLREGEVDVRLARAEVAQMDGNLPEARTHLDKALQLHRKEPRVFKALAGLELLEERKAKKPEDKPLCRAKALNWLKQGAQELKPPAQFDLLWSYASLLLDTSTPKELEEATAVINRIRTQNLSPGGADYLQGRLLIGKQQWAEAAKLLERARPVFENVPEVANQIDLKLGRCYDELSEPQQKFESYKRLNQRNPGSMAALVGMAQSKTEQGQLRESLRLYNEIVNMPGAPRGVWVEYVRLLVANALDTGKPDDWTRVEQALDEGKSRRLAEDAEIVIMRAEVLFARDQGKQALELLEQARKKDPQRSELWAALARLAQRMKDPKAARAYLEKAGETLKTDLDKVELRLAWAAYWVENKSDESRTELEKLAQNVDKLTPHDRNRLLHGLAEAHYRAGNNDKASELWKHLGAQKEYETDLRLRLMLFDLALQDDKDEDMTKFLGEIKAIEGSDGTFARHAEALRLIWKVRKHQVGADNQEATLAQAARLLDQVATARPRWSACLLAKAEIETLRGNLDQATAAYQQAYELSEKSPMVLRQLIESLRKQNRFDKASEYLARVKPEELTRANLNRTAAAISLMAQHTDRAIEQALAAIQQRSGDYRDHLWLGQMLAATGKKQVEAEEHLRKAVELEKKEAEPWVALIRFLVAQQRADEAKKELVAAQSNIKPEQVALAMGQIHSVLASAAKGDSKSIDEARKQFEEALKARPTDAATLKEYVNFELQQARLKEAEALLRRLVAEEVKKSQEDTEWAHGRLALLLSAGEDFGRFKEALSHVALKVNESGGIEKDESVVPGDSLVMRRLGARVLATNPQWRCRDAAIKRFEELENRQGLTTEDRFILAQLYEARGDWPKARQQHNRVWPMRDCRPQHIVLFIQRLLANRELPDALRMLSRLEDLYKTKPWPGGDLNLLELRVRVHEARNETDKVQELLRESSTRKDADPSEVLLLVSSLGRQKKFSEALNHLDNIWKSCPPEMAGGTSVALLRAFRPTEQQLEQVKNHLKAAVSKEPKSVNLLVQLGDVLDLSGSYQEAEEKYREALKLDEKNVLALNNLSWLLAQRARKGEEALELINRAIAVMGPRGELLDTRGVIYLTLGKADQAETDLQEALKETATPTRTFHLAQVLALANKREAAVKALLKAKELGLQPGRLHPVEQQAHRKLEEELKQN